ncbi:MAG: GIY-YIG nuclease family protein [Roseiarcus sp.]|jgi:hypothetical protein
MSEPFNGTIYLHRNRVNGKGYTGQTIQDVNVRNSQHRYVSREGGGTYFANAIRKCGWDAFDTEILETGITNQADLDAAEIVCIDLYNTRVPNGYNISEGGGGGDAKAAADRAAELREWFVNCAPEFAEDQRERDRAARRKRWDHATPEDRERIGQKILATLGDDGVAARGRAISAALQAKTPGDRIETARRRVANMTPEDLADRVVRAWDTRRAILAALSPEDQEAEAEKRRNSTLKAWETKRRNKALAVVAQADKLADLTARLNKQGERIADRIMGVAA